MGSAARSADLMSIANDVEGMVTSELIAIE